MKKFIILLFFILISSSSLFKGLFFSLERSFYFIAIAALSALYFIIKTYKKEDIYLKNWVVYLNALLVLAYIISLFAAVDYKGAVDAIVQYSMYFIVLIITIDFFRANNDKLKAYFYIPVISFGAMTAIVSLAGYAGGLSFLEDVALSDRLGATFQYTNTAAIYFLTCIIFCMSLLLEARNTFVRALLAGIGNILFIALFFTGSRGVFVIALFVAFSIYTILLPRGYKLKSLAYFSVMLLPIAAIANKYYMCSKVSNYFGAMKWIILSLMISTILALLIEILSKLPQKVKISIYTVAFAGLLLFIITQYSYVSALAGSLAAKLVPPNILIRLQTINLGERNVIARIEFDKDALRLIRQHFLLGIGGGGWIALYQSVQEHYYIARTVHNHYFQIFVEAGILGFASFLCLVLLSLYNYIQSVFTAAVSNRIMVSGLTVSFLVLSVHSAMDFNLTYGSMALLSWSLIALSASFKKAVGK